MTLFTGKGDSGTTSFFGCKNRFSKHSARAEALGTIDELNSLLGIIKALSLESLLTLHIKKKDISLTVIVEQLQHDLFIVQAEIADINNTSNKKISQDKVVYLETIANVVEKKLPPIQSFVLSGTTILSGYFDYARAVSRRAERRVIALADETDIGDPLRTYLNRLSSALYALARYTAHKTGESETPPSYK